MRRREFMAGLGGVALVGARTAAAATPSRIYHLATLDPGAAITDDSPLATILLTELAQRGYTVGKNLTYTARGALGQLKQLPQILQELKADKVDVVVCPGFPAARAAKASGIPTVIPFGAGDPVASELVASLAHPGGTLTGIADMAAAVTPKRLSLLMAMVPNLRRIAMLWNEDDLAMSQRYEASKQDATALDITVQPLGVHVSEDFSAAFDTMTDDPPDAILMLTDWLTTLNRQRVFDYAVARQIPAIYEYDFLVQDGGLMSYGPDLKESFERTAAFVDQIFQGARPADLPFEQPTRYLFALNQKTAAATGLKVPETVSALADIVIP